MSAPLRVMIVAGEPSGDQHAARLVRDLRALRPDISFFGVGGDSMRREGVQLLHDCRDMAVLGLWDVLARLPFFLRLFRELTGVLRTRRPDALLLVDYPGLNLRLAKAAHALSIPVFYYISPQVWAWNRSRIPKMAAILDALMVIFPFEVDVFKDTPLRPVFVGHPLVPSVRRTLASTPEPVPWTGPAASRIAILPGSRRMEVLRILPLQLAAAAEILRRRPDASFAVAAASPTAEALVRPIVDRLPPDLRARVSIVTGKVRDVLRTARAAMVCSGTATIETALLSTPMIVVYRANPFTWFVGRRLVRVKWLGMVNLIANRTLCPEFLQSDARPVPMAQAVLDLLDDDSPARQTQLAGLAEVADALRGPPDTPTPALQTSRLLPPRP